MRSTRAHIDLDALEWNVSRIRMQARESKILGMVKANAYGHGMIPIARCLEELGIDMLGTAIVDEALELRRAGITSDILILTPVDSSEIELVAENNFHVVVCDLEQAEALSRSAQGTKRQINVHIYVDTGMLREGFRSHETLAAVRAIGLMDGLQIVGICTHFATADDPTSMFLHQQLAEFTRVVQELELGGFTFEYVHAANSGALWMEESAHFTMIRPGIALYGYALGAEPEVALRPVMSVSSRINSIRKAWPGDTVSYGQRYTVSEECYIATVPIGYGDGYLRSLSGKAKCLIDGKLYPVVGSVCMDEIMVNVGQSAFPLEQEVVLLGNQSGTEGQHAAIDAILLAQWASTIPYELLTAVSGRVPRVYSGRLAAKCGVNTRQL